MKRALEQQNEKLNYWSEFNRIPLKANIFNEVKAKVFLAAILVSVVLFTSCEKEDFNVIPSNRVTSSNLNITGINSIDVSSLFHVYVNFSETEESIVIEANENLHSLIQVRKDGDRLDVSLAKNSRISGDPVLNLYVTTASLEEIIAEGAVTVEFANQLVTDQFEVELTGASQLKGSFETGTLFATIEGASKLEIDGSSNTFQIDAEGASVMSGFGFTTDHLKANLDGGCEVALTVQQKLNVVARGASKIYYKGNGAIESQNLKDASEIIKVN